MSQTIRIGTRDSELALWQANTVKNKLEALGVHTTLVPVKSTGDLILNKPLYELGITGVFTKTLDIAMLNDDIDIAVHSMKDVPTSLPKGIVQAAVLERANVEDILVYKGDIANLSRTNATIATGSLRRKAQWLHKYPNHEIAGLRGNVNSRLQKLKDNNWLGAVFAKAGLERINLRPEEYIVLDWMIPAPAQGAIMVVAMDHNTYVKDTIAKLNHEKTELCTNIERDFLKTLEGGCSAPIGALAKVSGDVVNFTGAVFSLDGKEKAMIEKTFGVTEAQDMGAVLAQEVLNKGGREIMDSIRKTLN